MEVHRNGGRCMNYLEDYYSTYEEDKRLLSRHGQVEYLTTMKYIHELSNIILPYVNVRI